MGGLCRPCVPCTANAWRLKPQKRRSERRGSAVWNSQPCARRNSNRHDVRESHTGRAHAPPRLHVPRAQGLPAIDRDARTATPLLIISAQRRARTPSPARQAVNSASAHRFKGMRPEQRADRGASRRAGAPQGPAASLPAQSSKRTAGLGSG